jgi:MFS family permease
MTEQHSSPKSVLSGQRLFRALWIANTASNIGTFMQSVGSAWLMTSLSASPLTVALLQTATSLSIVLLALPAGALADVFDRRRLLLITHYFMLVVAATLALLTLTGFITPSILLLFTFLLGLGAAVSIPSAMGSAMELVPKPDAQHVITLGGISINIGFAVGPILGGLVVASYGPWFVFMLNALSVVGLIIFDHRWHRAPYSGQLPPERVVGAMQAALRYVRHSRHIHGLFVRDLAFSISSSSLMALLPVLTRQVLGLGSTGFGVLVGCFGLGAIIGGFIVLPRLANKLSIEWTVGGAILVFASTLITLAYQPNFVILCFAMITGGIAQLMIISSLNFSAYRSAPKWIGIRVLSIHILVFQAGVTGGSILWGILADLLGVPNALLLASIALIGGLTAMTHYKLLLHGKDLEIVPALHWPLPQVTAYTRPDDGPVLIQIEYIVDRAKSKDFESAIEGLKNVRLRDGATNWGIFHDIATPGHYVETFMAESWAEHLRYHERFTNIDREIENRVLSFHIGKAAPVVNHFIGSTGK